MRTLLQAVATIALAGFAGEAQAQCSELTRLRSEAVEATRPMNRGLMPGRCDVYIRASLAWKAVFDYASDHQDVCDISDGSLATLERYRREAMTARNNVCAGRPVVPFPADIISR